MNPLRNAWLGILTGALALLAAIWVAGLFIVGKLTGLPHVVPAKEIELREMYEHSFRDPHSAGLLLRELQRAKLDQLGGEDQVLKTLTWVMSQTRRVADNRAIGGFALLMSARAGEGFVCGDLADLFREALLALRVPARRVHLLRGMFNPCDTHVSVEVWLGNRWQLFDTTSNVVLATDSGQRVSAATARDWFIRGSGQRIRSRFLGEVPYPARISEYPIGYETLFNNVFYEIRRGQDYSRALPIIGAFLGPEWIYQEPYFGVATIDIKLYRGIYNALIICLPMILLVLLSTLAVALLRARTTRTQVQGDRRAIENNSV